MSESYRALATDFFVNQRLQLKMDMPAERDAVLPLFERVRRDFKHMTRFRRGPGELTLESEGPDDSAGLPHQWVALRRNSMRSSVLNPDGPRGAYKLHKLLLDVAPNYLSISPLDIDYLELLFAFDLTCAANHDAVVFDALMSPAGGQPAHAPPLASLLDIRGATPVEFQPMFVVSLSEAMDIQAQFEVKTRTRPGKPGEFESAPITVMLSMRQFSAPADVKDLKDAFTTLAARGEDLLDSHVIPKLLMPIREAIASSGSA
jgi:hypothetical protein